MPAHSRSRLVFTRRRFLQTSTLATLAATLPLDRLRAATGTATSAAPKFKNLVTGRRVRLAFVGIGGRGNSNIDGLAPLADVVALCDVDFRHARQNFARFPLAPRYRDYRQLLDEMHDRIDAVVISTTDHMHFPAALAAIERGKHVYVEKPLSHTIGEARLLKTAAAKHGIVTQMGNQGSAREGCRITREWLDAGVIGPVREVHCWTNRPIWPQGMAAPLPDPASPLPATLEWDLWQGVAPARDYAPGIAPFNWRGYLDYGCGALGDMGCHILNAPFYALNLRGDVTVTAKHSGIAGGVWPEWAVITYEFPRRGALPPVKLVWYDGKKKPDAPAALDAATKLGANGTLYLGDKGALYDADTYGGVPRVFPGALAKTFAASRPPKTLPRAAKSSIYLDWINAIKGEGPAPCSNFIDHSVDLTETTLLGNLALLTDKPVRWDAAACAATGQPELNKYINKTYRLF
ncbi:MAG: Gfo/Idh/MocA family oxidoreductase [Opitutaceae bacterium]|nr:Gfo/Idh/MocA family oxidoreductase [Opitutaceae bacterium]